MTYPRETGAKKKRRLATNLQQKAEENQKEIRRHIAQDGMVKFFFSFMLIHNLVVKSNRFKLFEQNLPTKQLRYCQRRHNPQKI